jgi:hypothetical protein
MGGAKFRRDHHKCDKGGTSEQKRLTDGGRNKERLKKANKVYIDSLVLSALIDSGATTNPVDSNLAMKILKVNKIIVLRPLIRLLVDFW